MFRMLRTDHLSHDAPCIAQSLAGAQVASPANLRQGKLCACLLSTSFREIRASGLTPSSRARAEGLVQRAESFFLIAPIFAPQAPKPDTVYLGS